MKISNFIFKKPLLRVLGAHHQPLVTIARVLHKRRLGPVGSVVDIKLLQAPFDAELLLVIQDSEQQVFDINDSMLELVVLLLNEDAQLFKDVLHLDLNHLAFSFKDLGVLLGIPRKHYFI